MSKTLKEWQTEVHRLALEKGWHDKPRMALEIHMLVVSEVAEATEAVRAGFPYLYFADGKPEGEAAELADAVIRVMDYFEARGWDLEATIAIKHAYNKERSYRHGGKLA